MNTTAFYSQEVTELLKTGTIYGINGPVIYLKGNTGFRMSEMVYVGHEKLVGEVISLDKDLTTIQVYEETTGLRPGEKLYEELLVKTEELDKTENSMIFIERDTALSAAEIDDKLAMLKEACATDDDLKAKEVLRKVVPTFKKPEEVNKTAFKKQHRENEENSKKGMKVALF